MTSDVPLFRCDVLDGYRLAAHDIPAMQRLYDANPDYFLDYGGAAPTRDEAESDFYDAPPADLPFSAKFMIGFFEHGADGALAGVAEVIADLVAQHVWHIGFFMIEGRLRGSGAAASAYRALEAWVASHGAHWLRLGVIEDNLRAVRFWQSHGFKQVRTRRAVVLGVRENLVQVRVKPLTGGSLQQYLQLVARDQPDA